MKEIVGKNDFVFKTRSRKEDIIRVRHQVYYDLFEKCRNPSIISKFLMDEYGFKISRSVIYHGWYSIKNLNNTLDSHKFVQKHKGTMSTEDMLNRYLLEHLQMFMDKSMKRRNDINRVIKELMRRDKNIKQYESMGRN